MVAKKGVVLAMTLIFTIILALLAGVTIVLMTNQARVTEAQIRRVMAFYTAEAGIAYGFDQLRTDPNRFTQADLADRNLPDNLNGLGSGVSIRKIASGAPDPELDPNDPLRICNSPNGTSCLRVSVAY